MATYFILETVTREGMMTVEDAPRRSEGVVEAAERFDIEVSEWFHTVGNFDFIMKVEAPDLQSVNAFVMAVRRSGNVTAQLLPAFTPAEWKEMVARLA